MPAGIGKRRYALLLLAAALCVACGGTKSEAKSGASPGPPAAGSSVENPVMRCGPRDSYAFIAREFRCKDGKNPLHGDLEAAARSRSGSQPHPRSGDLVDTYEVPCAGGSVTVYVDMYGCAEQRRMLAQAQKESPGVERMMDAFDAGEYEKVIEHCGGVMSHGEPFDEFMWCGFIDPASLVLMNMTAEAIRFMGKLCGAMPPSGPKSDARINQVSATMSAIARGSGKRRMVSVNEANELLSRFSEACGIDPREVVKRLETERV